MKSKPDQSSFLEYLIGSEDATEDSLGEVMFPKGFEVSNLKELRLEFEQLANRYGLSLPAKLKKGVLTLEWKPLPGEVMEGHSEVIKRPDLEKKKLQLTSEELSAFSNIFESSKEN